MKKIYFFMLLIGSLIFNINAQQAVTIPVKNSFRINPIIGIMGDSHDADSRFVQRMLFSPLVMPLTDPIIDYAFEYDIAVSMISDVYVKRGLGWSREFDLYSPDDTSTWYEFKVILRDNLYFMRGANKGDKIAVSDVIFSYRTAQATLSLKSKDNTNTYTNAILRAQLADMESIDADYDANGIVFKFKTDRTTRSFIRFLNFAPVLSEKQLTGKTGNQPRGYLYGRNSSLDSSYDMRKMTGIKDFEAQPFSYGQYSIENKITPSNNTAPYLTDEIRIRKNPDWKPQGTPIVLESSNMGRHEDYSNSTDSYIVKKEGLNITSIFQKNVFLINHALNAQQYVRNGDLISRNIDYIETQRMYISSRLYGMFFSPGKNSAMFNDINIRKFFNDCVNREMMVNIMQNKVETLPNNNQTVRKFLSKIRAYSMYYPFFGGTFSGEERTEEYGSLSELNDYLKTQDISYSTNKTLTGDIESFNSFDEEKKRLLAGYFRGTLWEEYLAVIGDKFKRLQSEIKIEEKMRDKDGNIIIRILYDNEDDIAVQLYDLVQNNFKSIFQYLDTQGLISSRPQIRGVQLNKRAINDTLYDQYDLIIWGWNYRFDFMSDIAPIMEKNTSYWSLMETYNKYLQSVQEHAVTEKMMFDIANHILRNQMLITMLGVQNYILWDNRRITMSSLPYLDQYIIMFPYYWRKTSELR